MDDYDLNPSRFDLFVADKQPICPERSASKARKLRREEHWFEKSPNSVIERITWSPVSEPFFDRSPTCPRRSVSPKRSTVRSERFESKVRTSRSGERWHEKSHIEITDKYKSFDDEAPVCPKRSVSRKRFSTKRLSTSACFDLMMSLPFPDLDTPGRSF